MQRAGLDGRLEVAVQLVVQRPGAAHRRDVLRDAREVDEPVVRYSEGTREARGEIARAVETDDRHDATRHQGVDDLSILVRRRLRVGSADSGFVTENLGLEWRSSGPGSIPSSSTKRVRAA